MLHSSQKFALHFRHYYGHLINFSANTYVDNKQKSEYMHFVAKELATLNQLRLTLNN